MKYTCSVEIAKPLDEVISKFDSLENMKYWQPGFVSYEHLSGTTGEPGARSRLVYKMGRRRIEMTETIKVRNLPEEFTGTYDAQGALNLVRNKFESVNENKTLWTSENEFQFKGMMKLMGFLMPGAFRKQTMKYLEHFREFVESGKSVLDSAK